MKKYKLLALTTILLLSILTSSIVVTASQNARIRQDASSRDFQNVDIDILNSVNLSTEDSVIQIIRFPILSAFADGYELHEILEFDSHLSITYRVFSNGVTTLFIGRDNDGQYVLVPDHPHTTGAFAQTITAAYNAVFNVSRNFARSAEITNIFFLDSMDPRDGTFIYYETTAGNFIYVVNSGTFHAGYLIPLEEFIAASIEITEERIRNSVSEDGTLLMGGGDVELSIDLSRFATGANGLWLNSPLDNGGFPTLIVGGVAIAVVIAASVGVMVVKKNKS